MCVEESWFVGRWVEGSGLNEWIGCEVSFEEAKGLTVGRAG